MNFAFATRPARAHSDEHCSTEIRRRPGLPRRLALNRRPGRLLPVETETGETETGEMETEMVESADDPLHPRSGDAAAEPEIVTDPTVVPRHVSFVVIPFWLITRYATTSMYQKHGRIHRT